MGFSGKALKIYMSQEHLYFHNPSLDHPSRLDCEALPRRNAMISHPGAVARSPKVTSYYLSIFVHLFIYPCSR